MQESGVVKKSVTVEKVHAYRSNIDKKAVRAVEDICREISNRGFFLFLSTRYECAWWPPGTT